MEQQEEEDDEPVKGQPPLTDDDLQKIEMNFYRGLYGDFEMKRLLEALRVHRTVLRNLFSYWTHVPLHIISTANPVRTSTLDDLKRLVGLEPEKTD